MPIEFDNDSYLVSIQWSSVNLLSGIAATVLGFNGPSETQGNMETLRNRVAAALVPMLPNLDPQYSQTGIRVETASFSMDTTGTGPGSRTNAVAASPQVAVLWSKSANGKGRRNRGRNYWPAGFLAASEVGENGLITSGRLTTLTSMFNAFQASIEGSVEYQLSIPQSSRPGQESTPILPWPNVVAVSTQDRVATQRRRVRH